MRSEDEHVEFKKTTAELNDSMKSISSILNKHRQGTLYFGLRNNGTPFPFEINDSTTRDISRRIFEAIKPQIFPTVETVEIDGIQVIRVDFAGEEIPYSAFGKYYIRVADEDRELAPPELRRIMIGKEYEENWEDHLSEETVEDVDENTLNHFREQAIECERLPDLECDTEQFLIKLGLYRNGHLTNAGRVLFSKNSPLTLKMAVFATRHKETFLDISDREGNIFSLIDEGVKYLIKNIRWRVELGEDGIHREEIPEIPVAALRETVVNSFAHARYDIDVQHEIAVFSDHISITNPGSFANDYTPDDFYKLDIHSFLRNKKIARMLYLCKNVESFGSGLKKVYSLCSESHVDVSYLNTETDFSMTFDRVDRNQILKDATLNEQETAVLSHIMENRSITIKELSDLMGLSRSSINRLLTSLKSKKLIERVGSKRSGYWRI